MSQSKGEKAVQVDFPQHLKGGVYSNFLVITHTKEEFILDFMMVVQPVGAVTSRVVMSPGHLKRTIAALQENLNKYESKFGKIEQADEPVKGKLGFQTPHNP